ELQTVIAQAGLHASRVCRILFCPSSGQAVIGSVQPVMHDMPERAVDRRPIATRNRKWAQAATAWLAARNVSPNAISIAGMCACIVAGIALGVTSIVDYRILWIIAAL